ncbi:MAG: hypothetical protein AAF914_06725, partial [Pseudomonadota bacterium]
MNGTFLARRPPRRGGQLAARLTGPDGVLAALVVSGMVSFSACYIVLDYVTSPFVEAPLASRDPGPVAPLADAYVPSLSGPPVAAEVAARPAEATGQPRVGTTGVASLLVPEADPRPVAPAPDHARTAQPDAPGLTQVSVAQPPRATAAAPARTVFGLPPIAAIPRPTVPAVRPDIVPIERPDRGALPALAFAPVPRPERP